jgi:meromycolic acid enoyl-[acyl-carrier-protein] reductase
MSDGGSIVSLDFDARVAWPIYDWMGVAKAGLESVTRYLARDLGPRKIRVNTVSAGPIKTMAGKGIPGFEQISGSWGRRAPLGWDPEDPTPVGNAVAFLLSDLSAGITGEMIHVDGGFHAMGTELG